MGVLDTTEELNVSADRVWRASRDADNLMPKLVPHIFSSQEKLQGDGGVGTIRRITLGEGISALDGKVTKERIEALDEVHRSVTYQVIEGAEEEFSLLRTTISYTPGTEQDTCVAKWSCEYEPVGEQGPPEMIKFGASLVFKALEAYLESEPEAYTIGNKELVCSSLQGHGSAAHP